MKRELSAGGIVVRQDDSVWRVLLIRDMNDTWTFPKGLVDGGEEPESAAKREITEETGISGAFTCIETLPPIHYIYTRGERIKKTVQYFLFRFDGKADTKPQTEEDISEASWVTLGEAEKRIGYRQTNAPLLAETTKILARTP
jgi:8-oxo-dGTP diphosphatase